MGSSQRDNIRMADYVESQIIDLLERKTKGINSIEDKWISEWATLVEKYFKQETRNAIRLKAIAQLSYIFSKYHVIFEDDLMNKIILPNFSDIDRENDSVVRRPIVHLLFDIAAACLSYNHCIAILAIIRRILNKPFEQKIVEEPTGPQYVIGNVDIIDSRLIISSLNKLFTTKLHHLPIDPAVNMLDIAVNYLNLTYRYPIQDPIPAEIPMIRRELFSLFLNLRCNKYGQLAVLSPQLPMTIPTTTQTHQDGVRYSPFIICVRRPQTPSSSQSTQSSIMDNNVELSNPPSSQTSRHNSQYQTSPLQDVLVSNAEQSNCPPVSKCVSLDAMFSGLIECISQETDLDVLKLVFDGLPTLLANKSLVMTATDERINQLCIVLSDLTRLPKCARNRQNSRFDIVECGLRCLTTLIIYRKVLDRKSIKNMLAAFEDSLKVSRHPVVPLFTTCLIELQDSSEMTRFLPVVLNRLSKFSPTINLGISMLEFLSYLILFPKLYENFSEDEYKFIFAIALPYTNPFRFSDYITCLAFRVIAMWYLNCRPSLRCVFVEFVKKSLQSNVIQPFKENSTSTMYTQTPQMSPSPITQTPPITYSCPTTMSPVDQRNRSSSLNTENSFRTQQIALGLPSPQLSLQVNEELIETFADLLSRYKHGQCLAIAPKNPSIELLVDRSTSQTWLHGNSLITITSGRSGHGWAEIMIRRPTGNTSWVGHLQNTVGAVPTMVNQQVHLDALNFGNDIISLFSTMSFANGDSTSKEQLENSAANNASGTSLSSTATSLASSSTNLASSSQATTSLSNATNSSYSPSKYLKDPIPLPKDKKFDIALSNFDHITPYETHKIGVIYVAKNQVNNRAAILSNRCGSSRYYEFLSKIGTCIILEDIDPEIYFIGGLDAKGDDGKYAYFWKDNVTQVIFHVATFMPARDNDPNCNNKNRHIGNDHVCIVYNDSRERFQMSTIKGTGQFIMACIIITPLDDVTNTVEVECLPNLKFILGDIEPKVLSNLGASLYARQLAIHLNLASKINERRQCEGFFNKEPYVSNWVERLRCIKRIRQRLDESKKVATNNSSNQSRGGSTLK